MPFFSRFILGADKHVCMPTVPTDEIYPVHFYDDTEVFRKSQGVWLIRFDDVLDPDIVHGSLERLCTLPGWRKCGGRVRINVNPPLIVLILPSEHRQCANMCDSHYQKRTGRMEIHVPEKFTAERPAVKLTRLSHTDMSINDHPLASRLPRETPSPSVQASPEEFLDLSVTPETPLTMEDFLNSDTPQFNMHIISFKDATIVSLTWPHLLGDIMSVASVSEAWSLVMAGRESEVPAFLSAGNEDILETAGQHPDFQGKHILEDNRLAGVWFFIWLARYVLDMIRWPTMELRTIFLPPKTVKKLKAGATMAIKAGLPEAIPSNTDQATPFVSSADVVYAWLVCMIGQATFALTSRRSIMIGFPVDIRDRAPSIFPRAQAEKGVWVQNASPPLLALVTAQDVHAEHAVARVAQSIRHTINTQGTEEQVHALYRLSRAAYEKQGLPPIFGVTNQFPIGNTNWTKAYLHDKLDFSPAVVERAGVDAAGGKRASPARRGRPAYFHGNELKPRDKRENPLSRNIIYTIGTPEGGYWAMGKFHPVVWKRIRESLSELA